MIGLINDKIVILKTSIKWLKVHVHIFSCAVSDLTLKPIIQTVLIPNFEQLGSSGFHTNRKNVFHRRLHEI